MGSFILPIPEFHQPVLATLLLRRLFVENVTECVEKQTPVRMTNDCVLKERRIGRTSEEKVARRGGRYCRSVGPAGVQCNTSRVDTSWVKIEETV